MPSIHTALSVNAVAPILSTSTLQWTADGQACFLTKTSLYIMTPDHGLNFDLAQPIKSKPRPLKTKNASQPEPDVERIGWYRTVVQFDRPLEYLWLEQSQSWNAIVLGTLDIPLWAATDSPSGLSTNASGIVAALTSSMDFTLWTASLSGLNGERVKVFTGHKKRTSASRLDGSLLVAGRRAGMFLLFRYRAPGLLTESTPVPTASSTPMPTPAKKKPFINATPSHVPLRLVDVLVHTELVCYQRRELNVLIILVPFRHLGALPSNVGSTSPKKHSQRRRSVYGFSNN
uniref:Transcription factor IIIC 90kDa subunit N-terminal domain-containing protein n=1 Tax=Mycena chlorophos TaxID=658473 RepID=A0ABQ0LXX7_MYCCL|nr:predicted protein [Mycena chlorophos]